MNCTCASQLTLEICAAVGVPIAHSQDCAAIADDPTARYNAMAQEMNHQNAPALNSDAIGNTVANALGATITNKFDE